MYPQPPNRTGTANPSHATHAADRQTERRASTASGNSGSPAVRPEAPAITVPAESLRLDYLHRQNQQYRGSGGVSEENRGLGFEPAFLDTETGRLYRARFRDGRPAPMHTLDGLPKRLFVASRGGQSVVRVKSAVIAGYVRQARFYTRDQAAALVASECTAGC